MATEADTLKEIQRLLGAGEVQAAADYAKEAETEAAKAAAIASGQPVELPPPRSFEAIMLDFMGLVAMRNGHHREFQVLIDEFERRVKQDN